MTKPVERLASGPLDVIGDVHGEWGALRELLNHLGYDERGSHPQGRTPVFIGDLCDRGPDSPAVVAFVKELVESGRGQCILGNHELNLLRQSKKEGNGWFFDDDHDQAEGKFLDSKPVAPSDREPILGFFSGLPLALERDDLRVVHACWSDDMVRQLAEEGARPVIDSYGKFERSSEALMISSGLREQAASEWRQHAQAIKDENASVPMLPAIAQMDELHQMGNPVRVLTSGVERRTAEPFYGSGKWRFVERVAWWNEYAHQTPVVIGHYWRWAQPSDRGAFGKGGPNLFAGIEPHAWFGQHRNVFCVDYSVGRRFVERAKGVSNFQTRLGALRWPERTVVFDDGGRLGVGR